jgi:RNA polymerase sigma factor (TIGR02999 family)
VPESDHITALLQRWQTGEAGAQEELFQIVYRDLRRIAGSRLRQELRPHTLQATELVHEIYPQLARQRASWQNRSQFYAIASECMRRYLVDHARTKQRQKRGGEEAFKISLSDLGPTELCRIETGDEVLAVDRALSKLKALDETAATVIKYRYFGGMNREEIAEVLQVSPATVDRTYRFAKAWLKRELAFEFSPYLLSDGQITDKAGFIGQLRLSSGNQLAFRWREVLPAQILTELDDINEAGKDTDLCPKIVAEINKSLLGSLFQKGGDDLSDQETQMMPDAQISHNRRMLEEAFAGKLLKLT